MIKKTKTLENKISVFLKEVEENKDLRENRKLYLESIKFMGEKQYKTCNNFIKWLESQRDNYWMGISGSWRNVNQNIVKDTSIITRKILEKGWGILTGGSLGIPYIATEIVLKEGDPNRARNQLRIVLPLNRYAYMERYHVAYEQEGISRTQADNLTKQINYIDNNFPEIIFDETPVNEEAFLHPENDEYRKVAYEFRNLLEAFGNDGLIAMQVNNSRGVGDTTYKYKTMGKPLFCIQYQIKRLESIIRDYSELEIPGLNKDYPLEYHLKS